jgi:hypothetical protein
VRRLQIEGTNFSELPGQEGNPNMPQEYPGDHAYLERNVEEFETLITFAGYFSQMPELRSFELLYEMTSTISQATEDLWSTALQTIVSALPKPSAVSQSTTLA